MTPRRLVAACALALLAAGALPAESAHTSRTITVRGSKNTYVDVTFKSRFRLYRDEFDGRAPTITTKGAYAGVYVAPLDGGDETPGAGTLTLAGMPGWEGRVLGFGTGDYQPAGRYRVHLLTDGDSTVKMRAEGLRSDLVLTPAKRSRALGRLVHRTVSGVSVPVDRTVIPVTLRPTTMAVLAASHSSVGAAGDQRICLRFPGSATPCEAGGGYGGSFTAVAGGPYGMGTAMFVYPGDTPAGETTAEFVDTSVGVPGGMYAFALTID